MTEVYNPTSLGLAKKFHLHVLSSNGCSWGIFDSEAVASRVAQILSGWGLVLWASEPHPEGWKLVMATEQRSRVLLVAYRYWQAA
jgi:hypothetical protein